MKKVSIQEAILVALNKDENNNNNSKEQNVCNMLNFTNIKTINCVVDGKRGNAIDLETGCVYHIIQRDYWGIVSQKEAEFIRSFEDDSLFVYKFYPKNMEKISMLYEMYLNSRAQRKYQEYLHTFENKETAKVKKIGKKESK